ncbi:hypothetical protein N7528_005345 [Penicillium herquei]|nr:hypothetical protein N7528_005345 [Penicillium herquei]
MGRWGWRLFEGDQDLDIACDLNDKLGITDDDWEWTPTNTVNHSDMLAPDDARAIYQSKEFADELKNTIIPYVREKFDENNRGYDLFAKCRSLDEDFFHGKYRVIIFGAMMMRVGAKMKEEDLQYLRDLTPTIHSSPDYPTPFNDEGFRDPGRAQFLAALDHYQPGVPRSFAEPSCFTCGKIQSDIGRALQRCGRCKEAHYCGTGCQRKHWKNHKPWCDIPGTRGGLNV